ncbi:hypothetical protein [Rhodococcus sp. NPDC058639]
MKEFLGLLLIIVVIGQIVEHWHYCRLHEAALDLPATTAGVNP